jgi:hypothetical protein
MIRLDLEGTVVPPRRISVSRQGEPALTLSPEHFISKYNDYLMMQIEYLAPFAGVY